VAEQIENRLGQKVQRRLGFGGESILYQGLLAGDITVYPDYAASIEANILRERPDPDTAIVLERTRSEMGRTAHVDLLGPLGYEGTAVAMVRKTTAEKARISTLSGAAKAALKWKLGVSYDFQQRSDGLASISAYKIPMDLPRAMDAAQLFPALQQGQVDMIVANNADGHILSPDYAVLDDDQKVFPAYQACLLVRQDTLARLPKLQAALADLSGKLTTPVVRKLVADLALEHRPAPDIAAGFLRDAGLK